MAEITTVDKPWYKRRTLWCAIGYGLVQVAETAGIIPATVAETLLGLLAAGAGIALRAAVATKAAATAVVTKE